MKKILLLIVSLGLAWTTSQAQVTANPAIFTATQSVTLTYDATQSQGQALANLPNNVTTITAHVGAVIDNATSTAWTNVPGTWGDSAAQPKFTRTGTSNIYTLTLPNGVRSMFPNLPANATLFRVGMVFRENGPCGGFGGNSTNCREGKTAAGQDIFLNVNQGTLDVTFSAPTNTGFFVNVGDNVTLTAATNLAADLKLFVNNVQVASQNAATSITFNQAVTAGTAKYNVKVTATIGNNTVEKSLYFLLKQTSPNVALPANTRDGLNYLTSTSVRLALMAPQKTTVYLIGDFNNWEADPAYLMNRDNTNDRFWINLTGLTAGTEYGYQFVVYDANDAKVTVADPYAELVLDPNQDQFIPSSIYPNIKPYPSGKTTGIVSVLQTGQTPYAWSNATLNFVKPDKRNLVIYEAWVYDFSTTRDFQGLIDKLDYIKGLGVNALQLMPIMEFNGNISWGYNPSYYCAVDKAYGTRNKLKKLIDECHKKGMAIILDMVLNHAADSPIDGYPYVQMYPANNNPMFNPTATHPFNVFRDFNHDSPFTKQIVKNVNEFWLREFKFDGYRFDLSKGFTQNTQCANKEDIGCWNAYHQDRVDTWKRIADEVWAVDPTAYMILEHLSVDSEEEEMAKYRAGEGKGMMFWQNMESAYAENIMGFNGNNANISRVDFADRGFSLPHSIAYMESHDEERVMYKALQNGNSGNPNHNVKNLAVALNRTKAAAAVLFPVPGPKMVWQFGELGFDFSINRCENGTINNNCRLSPKPLPWVAPQSYDTNADRVKLYKTFAEIIKLKTTYDVFKSTDVFVVSAQDNNQHKKMVKITSQPYTTTPANANQMNVVIIANFDVNAQSVRAEFHHTGTWYDFFDGSNAINVSNVNTNFNLQPGEFRFFTNFQLTAPENELHPYTRPNAATNVVATPLSSSQIKIDWSDNSTIETNYRVERSTNANFSPNNTVTILGTLNAGTITFTDNGLSAQTQYFYRVVAISVGGERVSAVVNATTPDGPANAPSNVTATPNNPTGSQVLVVWQNNGGGATGNIVQRTTTPGANYTTVGNNLAATATSYTDVNVTTGTTYYYRVCAVKTNQANACSAEVSSGVVAIEDINLSRRISISPNPSTGKFVLNLDNLQATELQMQVIDVLGRSVNTRDLRSALDSGKAEIDLSNLGNGMYLLKFSTEKGFALKRIVKN
ncbi:MAG: alpha-amylase family glycosyl hydrolase [Microscillaceae bacterium]|jgi:1,4-alpha-glucan branching enzyme|nr:alpha-amylase family glycosyl hydrolase [Microscillaceae bacterium]